MTTPNTIRFTVASKAIAALLAMHKLCAAMKLRAHGWKWYSRLWEIRVKRGWFSSQKVAQLYVLYGDENQLNRFRKRLTSKPLLPGLHRFPAGPILVDLAVHGQLYVRSDARNIRYQRCQELIALIYDHVDKWGTPKQRVLAHEHLFARLQSPYFDDDVFSGNTIAMLAAHEALNRGAHLDEVLPPVDTPAPKRARL